MLRGDTWRCKTCKTLGLQYKRNCNFISKKKREANKPKKSFTLFIGLNKYTSCPLSLIKYPEVFEEISLVDWSETTGIPIRGTCIIDQHPDTVWIRSTILSERARIDYETDFGQRDDKEKSNKDGESKSVQRIDNLKKQDPNYVKNMVEESKMKRSNFKNAMKIGKKQKTRAKPRSKK